LKNLTTCDRILLNDIIEVGVIKEGWRGVTLTEEPAVVAEVERLASVVNFLTIATDPLN